jgi:TonB family protein
MMNWRLWLELLVRSGALLLAGEVLRRLSKASSAAFRHRLLLWVFALLALLPVLAVLFPEIPVSLWRAHHEPTALVTIQQVSSSALQTSTTHRLNWTLLIWLSGALAACVPLLVGNISAWRMARSASSFDSDTRKVLTRLLGKTEVLLSRELQVPVACGLLRPRILLPSSAEHWSLTRLEAVLLHELAHLRRRDLLTQVAAHLVAAVWWFQPLVWMARRRLRAESEFACDAEVLHSGFRASEYAAELLAMANGLGREWRLSSSAIGMLRPGDLEERLRTVLQPASAALTHRRTYVVGLALGAVSIAASAVSPHLDSGIGEQGGSIMKRTILSALLTSAGLSAATVGGYLHDTSGAAIADANVSIFDPDNSAKQEAMTSSDGKFSFNDTKAGQYILRIEKPGFASIFRVFDLKADWKMEHEFTMANSGGEAIPDSMIVPNSGADQPKHIRVGGQVAQNNLITKVPPIYPVAAKKAGVQGIVELSATISREGVPVELRVISSPSDDLSESSLEAVRQWRYRPTLLNGQPVEIETAVIVNYTLSR